MRFDIGGYRWRICALLFFATTINYIDRQVLALVVTDHTFLADVGLLGADGKLNKEMYGYLDAAFKAAYAIGFLIMGNLLDRIGNRKGFSLSIFIWSVAAMGHAAVHSIPGIGAARFLLGLGEAGNFPGSVKTAAEWFPKKERAMATGIFNAGTNIGAILAPLMVPWLVLNYSWRWAFIVTGSLGFIWLIFWLVMFRRPEEHPKVSREELAYIQSDPPEATARIPWLRLLRYRQTWAFAVGKLMTDPVWYLYLTWLPTFFKEEHAIDIKSMFVPMAAIYLVSDVGSIAGGWLSSHLLHSGWSANRARKTTFLVCACAVTPIFSAAFTPNIWAAIALIGLATASHQGWSTNLYTIVSDCFPKHAVASVIGIGGTCGAVGGMVMAALSGIIYQRFGPAPLFVYGSCAYLLSLGLVHLLNPRLEPVKL